MHAQTRKFFRQLGCASLCILQINHLAHGEKALPPLITAARKWIKEDYLMNKK
jgi:hypothetical protein